MASVMLNGDVIDIRFTGWERMWVGRERFALHLVLDRAAAGGEFDEVVVSDPAAAGLAETIGRATGSRP
ncbi:hypothetical protein ABIH81_06870 [Micromonospora sp. HUAS YX12]|uniref:Uncharacterized protein n=1 Tax=Micromonospora sp. HUAS YX12 TaxID=3156396 RepID=A0AAU7R4K8_9ACTN